MRRRLYLFLAVISLLSVAACDYAFREIKPEYAVPLINSRLSVYNLLARDSSNLLTSQDGQVTLVYTDSLLELDNFKILRLVNQSLPFDAVYPGPSRLPLGEGQQETFTGSTELNYIPATGEEIYKILYRAANLGVSINSSIQHHLDVELTFPGLVKNGQPFVYRKTLNYKGQNHSNIEQSFIGGYTLDLSRNGSSFNKLRVNYSVTVRSAGEFPLLGNEKVSFAIGVTAQNYDQVDAYIGKRVFPLTKDSISIRLFQYTDEGRTAQTGNFALTDPRLTIRVSNSFTIPFDVKFNKLATRQPKTGEEEPILLSSFQNPFSVQYPLVPGEPVITEQVIHRDNSNIEHLITPIEKQVVFDAEATSNPAGKSVNKISRTSKLKIEAELNLPLIGYGSEWILSDTTELGFSASEKEIFNSAILRLNIMNNFPIDVDLQLYFLDENMLIVDSLLANGKEFVKSGVLNAQGIVIAPTPTIVDIDVSPYKTDILFASKFVVITARLNTTDAASQKEVRIYDNYYIDVKMGIKAGVTLQP